MRKAIFIAIVSFIVVSLYSQKIIKQMTNETCDCIEKEYKKNNQANIKELMVNCLQISIQKNQETIKNEYGKDIFEKNRSGDAIKIGTDIGKLLVTNCESFSSISTNQAKLLIQNVEKLNADADKLFEQNELDKAIDLYSQAIKISPENYQYINSRGVAYFEKGDYYNAISDFLRTTQLKSNFSLGFYNLAQSKYYLNDYKGALTEVEKALSFDSLYCESHNLKGLVYSAYEKYDTAYYSFLNAMKCESTKALYAYNAGYSLYMLEKYDDALTLFETSVSLGDRSKDVYNYMAICFEKQKKPEKSLEYYTLSLQQSDSTDYINFYNRAFAYYSLNKYNESLADLEKAYSIDSTDVDIVYYMALNYQGLNEFKKAEKQFDKLISMKSDNAVFYDKRAELYMKTKKYDEAIKNYIVSINLYPNDCETLKALGNAYKQSGDNKNAEKTFSKIKELKCDEKMVETAL